jgi:tryptophan 2,3-dioxygenase
MIRDSIVRILAPHQLTAYLRELRQIGRKHVLTSRRRGFSELFPKIKAIEDASPNLSANEYITIQFASDFCRGENFLAQGLAPRYTTYTNLSIIDRYIGVPSHWTLARTFDRCRIAIALLVRDWLEFERSCFLNQDTAGTEFDQRIVSDRIKSLKGLGESFSTDNVPHVNDLSESIPSNYVLDWEYYACHQDGAAGFLHATSLRQSKYHDEYLFLRTLHIDEVCFWAIICGVHGAAEFVRKRDWQSATDCIREANVFAGHLQPVFKIFKTMPFASFKDGFRDETGDSSAIQSQKFQLIDLLTRGYSDRKRATISRVNEHSLVAKRNPLPEDTLPGMYETARSIRGEAAKEFLDQCLELDKRMRSWRGEHLGIVKFYLGIEAMGTGGEGYDYLFETFQKPAGLGNMVQTYDGAEPLPEESARPSWMGEIQIAHRPDTSIGLIRAEQVSKRLLVAFVDAHKEQFREEARERSDEIDARIAAYDAAFARYGYPCPLPGQKARLLKDGFPTGVVPSFVLALEMTTGVLAGLHECGPMVGQVRVRKAVPGGVRFKPFRGGELLLKVNELYFADGTSIFATYFQGPDKRTVVRNLRDKPQDDDIGDLLCLIMGAPDMPKDVFNGAMRRADEWLKRVSQRTTQHIVEVEL